MIQVFLKTALVLFLMNIFFQNKMPKKKKKIMNIVKIMLWFMMKEI